MNVRRIKFWANAATAISLLVAVILIARSILSPVRVAEIADDGAADSRINRPPVRRAPAITIAAFEDILDLDLRRPLFDAPPVALLSKPSTQPVSLGILLTGTFVEPGHSYAVFASPSGSVEVKKVGEKTSGSGAEVMRIDSGSVMLQFNGRPMILRVAKWSGNSGS